jgi:hypothetical protein
MTYLTGTRSFFQKDRLFQPLLTLMTAFDALGIATECMKTGVLNPTPGNVAIEAHQFGLWIKFSALKPTEAMTKTTTPTGFQFIFAKDPGKSGPQIGPTMSGYKSTLMAITTAIYVTVYEQHRKWVRQTFGADPNAWPPLFNFARAIRNFIVHHDGKVHFDNPNAAPVTWHHLTYSPADEGKQAVGHGYVSVGDLIVLLVEYGDAFDSAGCPFPV